MGSCTWRARILLRGGGQERRRLVSWRVASPAAWRSQVHSGNRPQTRGLRAGVCSGLLPSCASGAFFRRCGARSGVVVRPGSPVGAFDRAGRRTGDQTSHRPLCTGPDQDSGHSQKAAAPVPLGRGWSFWLGRTTFSLDHPLRRSRRHRVPSEPTSSIGTVQSGRTKNDDYAGVLPEVRQRDAQTQLVPRACPCAPLGFRTDGRRCPLDRKLG